MVDSTQQGNIGSVVAAAFVFYALVLVIAVFVIIWPTLKAKKKYGKNEFLFFGKFRFTGGLNLPQNVMCKVFCLKSRIVIEANGQEFNLPVEKLIDVSVMTNTEIQKQYVSSIGGAVAGAMLLGPIGAILGGTASQKRIKTNNKYLIFTYQDGAETKYILFDVTKKTSDANKFKKKYKSLKRQGNITVDL